MENNIQDAFIKFEKYSSKRFKVFYNEGKYLVNKYILDIIYIYDNKILDINDFTSYFLS